MIDVIEFIHENQVIGVRPCRVKFNQPLIDLVQRTHLCLYLYLISKGLELGLQASR